MWTIYSKEQNIGVDSEVKKAKVSKANKKTWGGAPELSSPNVLQQYIEKQKADKAEQAKNMKGIDINKLTSDESEVSFNFSVKSPPKQNDKVRQVKTSYNLHSRIHVDRNVNAQQVVQMVLKVLRKADPTVLILQNDKNVSQRYIEHEDNVP